MALTCSASRPGPSRLATAMSITHTPPPQPPLNRVTQLAAATDRANLTVPVARTVLTPMVHPAQAAPMVHPARAALMVHPARAAPMAQAVPTANQTAALATN